MNKQKGIPCCDEDRPLEELMEARFFKALGDPGRLELLVRLARCGRPCSVGEIARCCPTDLSVVSRHLAKLREAGILRCRRQGKEVYYTVCAPDLVATLRAIADAMEACCPPNLERTCDERDT